MEKEKTLQTPENEEGSPRGPENIPHFESPKQLRIEGFEDVPEHYRHSVEESFAQLSEKFGLSRELLLGLIDGRVEISKNGTGHEQMLAAFVWDGKGGKKLRIYEKTFLDGAGHQVSPEVMVERITYLLGHELSHAVVHTGAVVDLKKLHDALITGENDHGLADHVREYISKEGVACLERYFTRGQAKKYTSSGHAPSEQWSFAQEVIAERFHEYESAKGDKDSFIMERIKSLDLAGYIIACYPEKELSRPNPQNESEFWEKVGEAFDIKFVVGQNGPIGVFEKLSAQGGPLEFIKKDIDFWHAQFSESLGNNDEQKIASSLEEQNALALEQEMIYEDEFIDGIEHSNDWFNKKEQETGQMPDVSNSLGKSAKILTVPDALMKMANLMAGKGHPVG